MSLQLTGRAYLVAVLVCMLGVCAAGASSARAESTWRLEQPDPPPPPAGVEPAPGPVGLGKVGDIEFSAWNRGVLITAGNPPTIPPGVWIYNGVGWHELTGEGVKEEGICGAGSGQITWAGEPTDGLAGEKTADEFWTISNGRPGQADVNGLAPPLEDDTLCRFADGKVVESFAAPAFEASSYQPMQAAGCLGADDCWFAGKTLPADSTEVGAFQLHWNGSALSAEPYPEEGHTIADMRAFEGRLYESVQLLQDDPGKKSPQPPVLHVLEPELFSNFVPEGLLTPRKLYGAGELPWALNYLNLSAGPAALWAAAGQRPRSNSEGVEENAPVTLLRYTPEAGGEWQQLLGPTPASKGSSPFPEETVKEDTVNAVAAEEESGEESAWLALESKHEAFSESKASAEAQLDQISSEGAIEREETLGPKGAAEKLTCPAPGDCWMVTSQGWLYHLAPEGERTLPEDAKSGFTSLINERPPDKGLPQTLPDSLPIDDSGLVGEAPSVPPIPKVSKTQEELRVPVALVSGIHTRIVHGTTLELRLRLAVEARIQLLAKRKHRVVAKTPMYTFKAGKHKLLLSLNRKHWPTELHLVEHALAKLPTVSAAAGASETVET